MTLLRLGTTLVFTALTVTSVFAQNEPIVVEAESGTVGSA